MKRLEFRDGKLFLGDKEFYLASGDMHYFRILKGGWKRRLQLMKAFGLTAVQTYVPWNLHEPEKGSFDFNGRLDLRAFLEMCAEAGLYVLLRPSPYICSECDFGGLPYWLLKEQDMCPRTTDEIFIKHLREYYERLFKEFIPMLSTNGGPIIAVALENEYGSFGMDLEYLRTTERMYRELGVDVPLYTAGGPDLYKQTFGGFPEIWSGLDLRNNVSSAITEWRKFQSNYPPLISEFWGGCAQQWGGVFPRQKPETVANNYREALQAGAYVNFYMFCGGTNFGFFNGALNGTFRADVKGAKSRYIPFLTSYDTDALIDESGNPTEKYMRCREVLAGYRGVSVNDLPAVPSPTKAQEIGSVKWEGSCCLFDESVLSAVTKKSVRSGNVRTMESLGQDYGWILYTTYIKRTDPETVFILNIDGLHDRADIYCGGKLTGTYYRDRENARVEFKVTEPFMRLDILVENMGRINYGYDMLNERKGILGTVRLDVRRPNGTFMYNRGIVTNWECRTLPMRYDAVAGVVSAGEGKCKDSYPEPRFFRGTFKAEAGVDSYLYFHVNGMTKGSVWINGFNIGRYWNIGPQDTLYVPGEILKANNTIEVFELYSDGTLPEIVFKTHAELDSITKNAELVLAERA